MGGRGASGGGRLAGSGVNAGDITGLEDLVSMREENHEKSTKCYLLVRTCTTSTEKTLTT